MSMSVRIDVYVTVENIKEVEEIAHDLHEILNDNGITNSVNVTDDINE